MPDVLPRRGRLFVELAVKHQPERDVRAADQGQHSPPPGQGI